MKKYFFYFIVFLICIQGISLFFDGPAKKEGIASPLLTPYSGHSEPGIDGAVQPAGQPGSNVDARVAYGLYNNIFSSISLAQNFDYFTYQLNSDFRRTDDYGFENSSFYAGSLAFTGFYEIDELWKISPHLNVENESHGMYANPSYSREEKDKFKFRLQTNYDIDPTAWSFSLSGANYVHRLISVQEDKEGEVESRSFYKLSEDITWENIHSASNKFKITHSYTRYYYSSPGGDEVSDNHYSQNRAVADIKIMEYVKLYAALICDWHSDTDLFLSGRGGLSSTGLPNSVYEITYGYMLRPFAPEEFYFDQKFTLPQYNLPPQKVHELDISYSYDRRFPHSNESRFESFGFKAAFSFEGYDNYYNFQEDEDKLISGYTVKAGVYGLNLETVFEWEFFRGSLSLGLNYGFNYFYSDDRITYRPGHSAVTTMRYRDETYEATWKNNFSSSVYRDHEDSKELDGFVLGSLTIQKKIYDTFFLYLKIDNLYDVNYSYRLNYPEPGMTISAGLRIKY